jgi:AAA+ ATPase superfamily predicted ATPase
MKLNNPFIISNEYVSAEYFCDRKFETKVLTDNILNGRNTVLISIRRMGKSGLISHSFNNEVILKNYTTFFVDLYSTSSLSEMVSLMGKEILDSLKGKGEKLLESFLTTVRSLVAGITLDPVTGQPTLNISIGSIQRPEQTLEEIFEYLEKSERPCVVAIDEFQQIAEYPEKNVIALLRTYVQKCRQTQFIFSGSKRRMMDRLFNNPSEPFYQSCTNLYLEAIDKDVYYEFASAHFQAAGKSLCKDCFDRMYNALGGHTWYIQRLLSEMYASVERGETADVDELNRAMQHIHRLDRRFYEEALQQLTNPQKLLLIAIAKDIIAKEITSSDFVRKHSLKSSSSVQSAARSLYEAEIITREDDAYFVTNRFLGLWLIERYGVGFRF